MKLDVHKEDADALFMGTDGSMGFRYGQMYRIKLKFYPDGMVILKSGLSMHCPYSSIDSFFANWWVGTWR